MKMRFALTAVAATTALAILSLAAHAQAEDRGHVTASRLKCRATPEPSGQVVAKLRRGDQVRIVGRNGAWAKVRTSAPFPCWAAGRHLAPDAHAYRRR
jgi:uncharacterized protein YgiM (DUF1202 family)